MALDPEFAPTPADNMARAFRNVAQRRMPDTLRWDFACFAVCEITPADTRFPVDRDNQDSARLALGFFQSREEADAAIVAHEALRQTRSVVAPGFCDYAPRSYEVVPVSYVHFSDLAALEAAILAVALDHYHGIGGAR